jgi:glycosyltransferase involved in cell wall biosynthesis
MITTCLVNNYNYAQFVCDAIDSALGQTVPFDEIIVVDDGSTDGSPDLLARRYARHSTIQIVTKHNQGQLSCFNEGFARSTGDLVFFLDADDIYEPNYLEQALDVYRRDRHVDFVFCGLRHFGQQDSVQLKYKRDRDLGYSVILAAYLRDWIGGPTSCLSMRRGVLEKILPLPHPEAWRTRADDCLVFGASLAGARKYYLARPLVRYRVHGKNLYFGCAPDRSAVYRRRLAINVLFEHLRHKLSYDIERLGDVHHREFCTIEKPTFLQLMKYFHVNLHVRASILRRLACGAEMARHFMRTAMRLRQTDRHDMASMADLYSEPPTLVFPFPTSASTTEQGVRSARSHRRHAA